MREKNPQLTPGLIDQLAAIQWSETARFDASLAAELQGISQGANRTPAEIIVLNNYTDFRDLQIGDQGCSVVWVNYDGRPIAGQTWDMHASAKHYVSCLKVPLPGDQDQMILFSLVGCLGMTGYSNRGVAVGVNNIHTDGAVAGVIWPAVVRHLLRSRSMQQMVGKLRSAPVTSGHHYLLATRERAEMWEVMPGLSECVGCQEGEHEGYLYHTNHCLGPRAKRREKTSALSQTTHPRFELIGKKIGAVRTFEQVIQLLNDHENYPLSICSNLQTGAADPAVTCGGAVGDLHSGRITMWRGDPEYDSNYVRRDFQFNMAVANPPGDTGTSGEADHGRKNG
jgi:isopenicillin-N N-acyltransferase-like protein